MGRGRRDAALPPELPGGPRRSLSTSQTFLLFLPFQNPFPSPLGWALSWWVLGSRGTKENQPFGRARLSSHTSPPWMVSRRGSAKGLAGRVHGGDPGVAKMEMLFSGMLGAAAQEEGCRAGRSQVLASSRTLPGRRTSCPAPREPSVYPTPTPDAWCPLQSLSRAGASSPHCGHHGPSSLHGTPGPRVKGRSTQLGGMLGLGK